MAVWALAACGGGGGAAAPDAGMLPSTLEILAPGESLGLAFGQRENLAVRLVGPGGVARAGVPVAFALAADQPGETAAGATLGAAEAVTDASGRAAVDVVAGAVRGAFRVRASAETAAPVHFTITVSNEGFADLEAGVLHVGGAALGELHVRLYRGDVRCADLRAEAPPSGPFPVRELAGVDEIASYETLAIDEAYALLAWSEAADERITAKGCVDIAPRQLRPATTVLLRLPLVDRPLAPAETYAMISSFDLSPLRRLVVGEGRAWSRAACALGAAQLVLDCAIDTLDDADAADCVVEGAGPTASLLQAARGILGADGCRAATMGAGPSLEALLAPLLAARAPEAAALQPAARTLADLLDSVALGSTLTLSPTSVTQRLETASFESGGIRHDLDLRLTAQPVLVAFAPAERALAGDELVIATLSYTLRLGHLVDVAFRAHTGLPGREGGLGRALLPAGTCGPVSALVCPAAGQALGCLEAACQAAAELLDAELAAPFALISGTAIDFIVEGSAVLVDGDGDLVADQLTNGSWATTARLRGGEEIELFGVFQGTAR